MKHFIGNEQETQRTSSTNERGTTIEAVNSNIDDRTMHELYLWPFADAVRAGVSSVMCSYNRVNGTCKSKDDANLKTPTKSDEIKMSVRTINS